MKVPTRAVRPVVLFGVLVSCLIAVTPTLRRPFVHGFTTAAGGLTATTTSLLERTGLTSTIRLTSPSEVSQQDQLAAVTRQLAAARQEIQSRATADQLGQFVLRLSYPSVAAAVVGYSPDPGVQSLVINVGRDRDIRAGQAVITGDGWLIGKIAIAHETTSTVVLLTDAQSLVLASIQNDVASQGVVRGERGLAVQMDLIPKNDRVQVGQSVVTSGLEAGIPPDLLIGTVSSIIQRTGEVFQRSLINVPIRYGRVRQVAVVTL